MNTRSWDRWVRVLATAACLGGCGSGAVTADAGVLTKGQGGTQGLGGTVGAGVGGAGVGVGVGGGGASGAGFDGGAAGGADGSVDAHADAPSDLTGPTSDAASDDLRPDVTPDVPANVDAAVDLMLTDLMSTDVAPFEVTPVDASAPDTGPACPSRTTAWAEPRFARSGGYSGTLSDYSDLYDVPCTSLQQCKESCVAAGGTTDSCTTGSECTDGVVGLARHCLPPTYWRYGDRALDESGDWTDAAEQTLVVIAYNDPLVIRDFRVNVPPDATIRGIQFEVSRAADEDTAVDDSIRVLRNGQPVGTDHKKTQAWPADLASAMYGGLNDTWGVTWTPGEIEAAGFGIAVAARYTLTAGNARAYVDYVRVRVSYVPASCDSSDP